MSKVLIIGANGQLGFDLKNIFQEAFDLISPTHKQLDITEEKKVENYIKKIGPDIIINTAAYHNTTLCERNPETSFKVNALGAYYVAKSAKIIKARVIFFSTDYIFDGQKKGYFEDDKPNPLNVYGASKLSGEVLTKIANPNYIIVRTGWLYGAKTSGKGHNFAKLMLEESNIKKSLDIVNDQFGSPTYTKDLAEKIREIVIKNPSPGTYHIVNSGFCSWYDFANEIFKIKKIEMNLKQISSKSSNSKIKRPKFSILKSKQLKIQGILPLRNWKKALEDFLITT